MSEEYNRYLAEQEQETRLKEYPTRVRKTFVKLLIPGLVLVFVGLKIGEIGICPISVVAVVFLLVPGFLLICYWGLIYLKIFR
mgnify:CR=1 FL=1